MIKGWDDLFTKLNEHLGSLTSMKMSPFFKVFEDEQAQWDDKLQRTRALFDVWIDVQVCYGLLFLEKKTRCLILLKKTRRLIFIFDYLMSINYYTSVDGFIWNLSLVVAVILLRCCHKKRLVSAVSIKSFLRLCVALQRLRLLATFWQSMAFNAQSNICSKRSRRCKKHSVIILNDK